MQAFAAHFRKCSLKQCDAAEEVLALCDCVRKYEKPRCGASRLLGLLRATEEVLQNTELLRFYL